MQRVTEKQLKSLIDHLNKITGNNPDQYSDGSANIGNYHLSCAYGGYALHQMTNEHGGVRLVVTGGHVPKRELFNLIHAYINGIDIKTTNNHKR